MAGEAPTHTIPWPVVRARRAARDARAASRSRPAAGFCLTDRDLELLRFAAAHRFVLARQVRAWMGAHEVVVYRRLRGLINAGLMTYERLFHRCPGCYLITTAGLAVIESSLPRPVIDLRSYRHDTGVVWLWVRASRGALGPHDAVWSERQMRSHDQRPDAGVSFAVPLGGYAPSGKPRVHLPDVLLERGDGSRVAVELELTLKSRSRLEAIFAGYAAERRIERLVYLTDSDVVRAALEEMTRMFGVDAKVSVVYLGGAFHRDPGRCAWEVPLAGELAR